MDAKRTAFALGTVAIAVTAAVWWTTRSNRSAESEDVVSTTPVRVVQKTTSRGEISELETQIEELRAEIRILAETPREEDGRIEERAATESETVTRDDARREPAIDPQQIVATYESAFWDQERDATWGETTEASIRTALEGVSDVELLDVACQTTLCRLEVYQPGDNLMDELPLEGPFLNQGFYHPTDDGRMIVYLAREGHKLPRT